MPIETPLSLAGRMSLSHLWRQHHDLVRQTLETPFIQQLCDGSIQESLLIKYYLQDEYFQCIIRPYRQFIKTQVNNKSGFNPDQGKKILEENMQSANSLGITPNSATNDYIQYILAHSGSLDTAAVSLLPCSKLYNFLTRYLRRIHPSEKCIGWIGKHTYSGYKNNTNQLEYLVGLSQDSNIDELSKIFREGLKHEISFFSQVDENLH